MGYLELKCAVVKSYDEYREIQNFYQQDIQPAGCAAGIYRIQRNSEFSYLMIQVFKKTKQFDRKGQQEQDVKGR